MTIVNKQCSLQIWLYLNLVQWNSPEAITLPQEPELEADDAAESGTDHTALERAFWQTTGEEVDVVHVGVDLLQPLDDLGRDFSWEVVEALGTLEVADHSVVVVRADPVVTA